MATSKKTIEPQKKWWTKSLEKTGEILKAAGLAGSAEYTIKGILCDINLIFMKHSSKDSYVRKSVILNAFNKSRGRKNNLLEKILSNKWLFYSQDIDMGMDALIQPIFNMEKITESKLNALLTAITYNNFEKVKKLVPNEVAKFEKYSCCLFKEEEEEVNTDSSDSFHNPCQSVPACDRSELSTHKTAADGTAVGAAVGAADGTADGTAGAATPIISTGDANKREKENKKENRELNIEGRKDIGPLVREAENEPSLPPYQKTELDLITKQRLWKDYLANLKVDSKEMQALLNYAGEDRPMIENNFELFKFHLLNRTDFRRKDECPLTASDAGKNEYIYNLLKNSSERRNLVKHIQESIEAKRKRDFVQGKPGYPFDFFNKKGQRISGDRIVPDDAPPRPSDEHFWNGKFWNHR